MSQTEPRQRDDSGAALERAGWTRRFSAIGPRLNEAVELYQGLGFDIRLEPAGPRSEEIADRSGCAQCFVMSPARTIYTRPLIADADELPAER